MSLNLRYFGSKYFIANEIVSYMPSRFSNRRESRYVEPLCGSCAVFLALEPRSAIINDLNDNVFNFWEVIRTKPRQFTRRLKYTWCGDSWVKQLKTESEVSDVAKAVLFYVLSRGSFGGTQSKNKELNHTSRPFRILKDIDPIKAVFDRADIAIWHLDFRKALDKIIKFSEDERAEYCIYLDPPYIAQGHNYDTRFEQKDHDDLLEYCLELRKHSNMILFLSYDKHPWVIENYIKKNNFYYTTLKFCNNSRDSEKRSNYSELLISNKPLKRYRNCGEGLSAFLESSNGSE